MNQCATKHLALGSDWFNNGRKLRIPTRNRIEVSAAEIRAGESTQSQLCLGRIGTPKTQTELELYASIHDAMTVGHDRSYKKLGWWINDMRPGDLSFCIRIFDSADNGPNQSIIAYQYSSTTSTIFPMGSMNLLVTNGHILFLTP